MASSSEIQTTDCDLEPVLTFEKSSSTEKFSAPEICVGELNYSSGECADSEAEYIASLQAESLNIAGGSINLFLLLGVHSQGSTQDTASSNGYPISSGTPSGYNALDAFNSGTSSWRSSLQGADVTTAPAYIGYSFGTKKAWEAIGRAQERYFPSELIRKQISSFRIKQGLESVNRATQARVEASDDGLTWHRVGIVQLPNVSTVVKVGVNSVAKYNQWRIIPTFFNGVASNSQWEIEQLQFLESSVPQLEGIQDFFLMENRDRAYSRSGLELKCQYDLLDVQTELARFGINIPQTYVFTTSFAMMIQKLGRPVVIGDIIEIPGETQYDSKLNPIRKWVEVTDTAWSTEGYAFNWKPQLFKFYAQPLQPAQEHRDLFGLPGTTAAKQSDSSFNDLGSILNIQAYQSNEAIVQEMKDILPQTGSDGANIKSGKALTGKFGSYDGTGLYVQDAIPPDGANFSSGDALPLATDIVSGHYHRQTYTMLPISSRPGDRLLRWDGSRWRVVEVNTKVTPESHRKTASKLLSGDMKSVDFKP